MKQANSPLRKAAVLISALDDATADRLLEQMGNEQAARVRNAILHLGDVPAHEQETVLAEFFGRKQKPAMSSDVEVEFSAASQRESIAASTSSPPTTTSQSASLAPTNEISFDFLNDVAPREIAKYLQREYPPVIAAVVTHIAAEVAAEVLKHLPLDLRSATLDHLQESDDADPIVLREIEIQLRRTFAPLTAIANPRRRHQILSILQHLQPSSNAVDDAASITIAPVEPTPVQIVTEVNQSEISTPLPASFDEHDESVRARTEDEPEIEHHDYDTDPAEEETAPLPSFAALGRYPTREFFAVFDEADPRLVMVALAGAPREMFQRYVARFSPERAKEFERHLEQLKPLSLRDVEFAQQALAKIAGRHRTTATIAAEKFRSFAAAV